MFLIKLCVRCFENHFVVTLLILTIFLTLVYFSNYIRICYFVRKIPGPRAYPIIGNSLMLLGSHEDTTNLIFDCAYKNRQITRIWFGPVPMMITLDPDVIQEILLHTGLEKAWIMKVIAEHLTGDSILISKVAKWKHNRSIVIRGFSPIILKSYFKIFLGNSLRLTQQLDAKLNDKNSFDILAYLAKTTLDSVCGSAMGVDMNTHEHNASYFHAMESAMYLSIDRGFNPVKYPRFLYRFSQDYKQIMVNQGIIWGLTSKIISDKRNKINVTEYKNLDQMEDLKKNMSKKPLLDYLLDFTESDPQFTDDQLRDEINLVIMAAYETSANALSYVLLNLAARKDIQQKVYDELVSVLGEPNRAIDSEDLPNLRYMEMVIKESMRLYSTVPLIVREISSDMKIGDYVLPKGSACMIPIFCLHRDPNIWNEPLKFDPERFSPENVKNRHAYTYIPFAAGPRNCLGMKYAWMFMKTALATLLTRYEFHTDLNMDELKFEIDVSLKLVGGHQLRITQRSIN